MFKVYHNLGECSWALFWLQLDINLDGASLKGTIRWLVFIGIPTVDDDNPI